MPFNCLSMRVEVLVRLSGLLCISQVVVRGLYRFCGMRLKFKWDSGFYEPKYWREAGFYFIAGSGINKNTMAN